MNKTKLILITFLLALGLNQSFAQSHNLSPGSLCKFSKTHTGSDSQPCPACDKTDEKDKNAKQAEDQRRIDERITFGALAVDRTNGFYYGWSYDYASLAEAEKKAVDECVKRGGDCSVVLSFSGAGCAAYRTINGKVGTAFGWGLAETKEAADATATKECMKRSKGAFPSNNVWTCNSLSKVALKEIYNARDEISDFADTLPVGAANAIAFTSDGRKLAVGGKNGIIKIWAMPSFNLIALINTNPEKSYYSEVGAVAFSPDGKTLAASCQRNKVTLWDVATGKLIKKLGEHMYEIPALSFSPDGKLLGSAGEFSSDDVKIWDLASGSLLRSFKRHEYGVRATPFSPDSKILATVSIDGTAKFWDTQSWQEIRTLNANNEQLIDGEFSPDGKSFVTIAFDGDEKIKLWDVASGKLLQSFPGHGTYGYSVAFIEGGKRIISSGMNDTFIVWNLTGGQESTYSDVEYWELAVSPDGTVASVGASGLQIWKFNETGNLSLIKTVK